MKQIQCVVPLLALSLAACQAGGVKTSLKDEVFTGSRDVVSNEISGSIKPDSPPQKANDPVTEVAAPGEKEAAAETAADGQESDAKTAMLEKPVEKATVPPGDRVVIQSYRPPKVGTIFAWRNNWASIEPKLVYKVASVDDEFNGRPAMRFESIEGTGEGARTYFDLATSNLVGHKDKAGNPLLTYQQVEQRLKFPMKPGNKWVAAWKTLDHKSNKVQKGGGVVTVIGVEKLRTDAGNFKTMKIRLPLPRRAGNGLKHHIWYSPKLGIVVREQISNNTFSWIKELERVVHPSG